MFYETLRLFPPVSDARTDVSTRRSCSAQVAAIPKYAAEDTVLQTRTTSGEPVQIPIPKGTQIAMHTPGLHYNRTLPTT